MGSVIEILRDNWLLLLIGQYPNGPLGGIACTLILSVLGIVLAFPLSVLLALARISRWRWLNWPATALIYVARGVPLLMIILWVYFLVPLLIGHNVSGFARLFGPASRRCPRARWRPHARSAMVTSARCAW